MTYGKPLNLSDEVARELREAIAARTVREIVRPELGPCWIWQGEKKPDGYGRMYFAKQKRRIYVHRAAFEAWSGPADSGLVVMHLCDYPPCCNPDHLKLDTQSTNMRSAGSQGRMRRDKRGEKNRAARLTADDVLRIRSAARRGKSTSQLAKLAQVSESCIRSIISRRTWRHV